MEKYRRLMPSICSRQTSRRAAKMEGLLTANQSGEAIFVADSASIPCDFAITFSDVTALFPAGNPQKPPVGKEIHIHKTSTVVLFPNGIYASITWHFEEVKAH